MNYASDYAKDRSEQEEKILAKFREESNVVYVCLVKLESVWESIENELKKLHIISNKPTYFRFEDLSGIGISISGESDGSFKFLKDQGYDSKGRAKNYNSLQAKAEKIENALNEASNNLIKFSVNPYSIEDNEKEHNSILIEGTILI